MCLCPRSKSLSLLFTIPVIFSGSVHHPDSQTRKGVQSRAATSKGGSWGMVVPMLCRVNTGDRCQAPHLPPFPSSLLCHLTSLHMSL